MAPSNRTMVNHLSRSHNESFNGEEKNLLQELEQIDR